MKPIKEKIYLWLHLLQHLDYMTFIRLLYFFQTSQELYRISCDHYLFEHTLQKYHIQLSPVLLSEIMSSKKKWQMEQLWKILQIENIQIIPMYSKEYPSKLFHLYHPPFVLLAKGNVSLLQQNPIVYWHYQEDFTSSGKKMVQQMSKYWNTKKGVILMREEKNGYCEEDFLTGNYQVICLSSFSKRKDIQTVKTQLTLYTIDSLEKEWELIAGLLDAFVVVEARYEKEAYGITMLVQELGKDILAMPGYVQHPNFYFSNYLIKEGAYVLLCKYHLDDYINGYSY